MEAQGEGEIPEAATPQEAIQAMEDIAATVVMAMLEIGVAEGTMMEGTMVEGTQGEGEGITITKDAAKSSN